MSFRSHRVVLSLVLLTGLATFTATAQEKSTAKSRASAATASESESTASRTFRRLPTGFGALNLTAEQKDKVYSIREDYGAQIQALQEQVAALRDRMDKDCEGVLTAAQKKELAASRTEKPAAEEPPATVSKAKGSKSSKKSSESDAEK